MIHITRSQAVNFLLLLLGLISLLYLGRTFLIPLAFGGLLAMMLYPLYKWVTDKGLPNWSGIGACVLVLLLILGSIVLTVTLQTRSLVTDWPEVKEKLQKNQQQFEAYIIDNVGIVSEARIERAKQRLSNQAQEFKSLATNFFGSVFSTLTGLTLAIVYMVFFLLAENRITHFIYKLFPQENQSTLQQTLVGSRQVATQYLVGRLVLIGILSILYGIGFLIFGLQYAIPLALLAAICSLIPFIGNILGGVFALAVAMATGGGSSIILGVIGTMTVAQILENYVLTPWIMGENVALNPLTTFTAVVGFGVLWGVAGSILAIPIIGVLKRIFDHVEGAKPYGYLLGLDEA